jgi:DtxR family transcriptional regulator, Mn-dependent transcriptional regulator
MSETLYQYAPASLVSLDQPSHVERSYLEVIFYLAARQTPVVAVRLARWLRVSPPTVTVTLQRMRQKGLIVRETGGAITLTEAGATLAEAIVRRHRLLECFLADHMQIPWHELHREASRLEPALSALFEARMLAMLGAVTTCPHGNPIPGQGAPPCDDQPLAEVEPGSWVVITRIDEEAGEDPCMLQLFWARGLLPGTALVRLPDATNGLALRRADRRIVLSRRSARLIWVTHDPHAGD